MKKHATMIVASTALTAVTVFLVWFFLIRQDRIAYVDANRLLSEYKGAVYARKQQEDKTAQVQANVDTLVQEVQQLITAYEADVQSLREAQRGQMRETINTKQQQLRQYQQAVQENMLQEDGKVSQEVIGEINRFLADYGSKKHYKLILIASNVGTIAYAAEHMDLTDEVLKELNSSYTPPKS